MRLKHPNLHRRKFFQDRQIRGSVVRDIAWYNTDGQELGEEHWHAEWNRTMGVMLNGKTLGVTDDDGEPIEDASFLMLVNAYHEGVEFTLPPPPNGEPWKFCMRTENIDDPFAEEQLGDKVIVGGRSLVLLTDEGDSMPVKAGTDKKADIKSKGGNS
jgi:glycogen operon protein